MAVRPRLRRLVAPQRGQHQTLDLFAPAQSNPVGVQTQRQPSTELRSRLQPAQLWLALRFPTLPLLAVPDPDGIQAVVEGAAGRQSVLSVTPAAQQLGVQVGLARAAAEIRVPQLIVYERRTDLEQQALRARARAAFAFTPFVSIEAPDMLLLEIQGSLQLFGGLEALLARAQQTLSTSLIPALYAVAPTVRAAVWLARGRAGSCVTSVAELPSMLARLPLAVTGFDATVQATCERLGVTTLGELMRLPRDGVARRLTPEVPQRLDEALGRVSQPRRRHVLPERFMDSVDLPADGVSTAALQPWCERLLAAQERFLVQRDSAVAQCRFRFKHRAGHPPSLLVLERSWPSGRAGEWQLLLAERLARFVLPAAVIAISLRSGPVLPAVPLDEGLVGGGREGRAAAARLLDRLRARLGEDAVHGVCLVPEHRPESAFRRVRPTLPAATLNDETWPGAPRPLWLMTQPEALRCRGDAPWYGGPLKLLSGPERIESGWWSGQSVTRDYYVVRAASGARLWVYRERGADTQSGWFLHGVFA